MKNFHHPLWICLLILIFSMPGCSYKKESHSVLVVLSSETDLSYGTLKDTAEQWADEKMISLQVVAPQLSTVYDQQKILENSIKEKQWNLIVIEPLGDSELSPLLEYAREQGSTVVAIQGTSKLAADYAIHPCDYEKLGESMMDALAADMEQAGSYVSIVPAKDSEIILQQESACMNRQKYNYRQMLAASRLQEGGDVHTACDITDKLYQAYEMKGVLFFSYIDGLGISQWKQKTGNRVAAVGIGFPELMSRQLEDGSIDTLFSWNRENLLRASLEVGYKAVAGSAGEAPEVITTGIDGYRTLRIAGNGIYVGSDISIISTKN